jgi:hypothetical protein
MNAQEAHEHSERKRAWSGGSRLFATLVAFTAVLALGASAARATTAGPTPPLTAATVNNGPGDQSDPHISGSVVSYTSAVSGESEIRHHDLVTGSDAAIPTNAGLDFLSDIAGSTVVYTHLSATSSAIFAYDRATAAPPIELDPRPASNRRTPTVGNQTVAWVDLGFFTGTAFPEIVAYDLVAQTATRLTNDLAFDTDPAVARAGSLIVWTKCETAGSGCDIWQATSSGAAWTSSQLTGAQGEENLADTNGQLVVYSSLRVGDSDIFWQPAGGGLERRLALPGAQRNPNISGDLVAFESFPESLAGIPNWDLMLYDLGSDTVYRLTQDTVDETLNDISVTADGLVRVVYTAQEGTDANVYALSFRLAQRTKLAFASNRDGNSEIYTMNPDGSGVTRLTTNPALDATPAWSPDGGQIAFTSTRNGNSEIYVMNADGSAQTRVTSHPASDTSPGW